MEALVMEAIDILYCDDKVRGQKLAQALSTYCTLIYPFLDNRPMDDVWRDRGQPENTSVLGKMTARDLVGYHLLGYAYDFNQPYMNQQQADIVRKTIAKATYGKIWMGARLPHHFRNWNWIAVASSQPLLALAIEGEEGYDPRVTKLGAEVLNDYLSYAISPRGTSTEAVGYTQFGLFWANPLAVAFERRGEKPLEHNHFRSMLDWYLHTGLPSRKEWMSSGDGGDHGPSLQTCLMWRYFYPEDPRTIALWNSLLASEPNILSGTEHILEALFWSPEDLKATTRLKSDDIVSTQLPFSSFDPARGSLIARSDWSPDATWIHFECRTDSVGASHEHADRGNFCLAAMGRTWAKDNFRSVETRHHNSILIDGRGQGYWPGPGEWLEYIESGNLITASCNVKDAYDSFWPKQILTEDPENFERFQYERWETYKEEAKKFQQSLGLLKGSRDQRESVKMFWSGYEQGDPRLWDEDAWPVRYDWNPVQKAYRKIVFNRGANPYLLVIDDIRKDNQEHLYEWLMQTGLDTEIFSYEGNDIILCDATLHRDSEGKPQPQKGDRLLLVRILSLADPQEHLDYTTRPSCRLETFERKDTLAPDAPGLSGSRSFGLDKRLVIASRSVEPKFRILLYPFRHGEELPKTQWLKEESILSIHTSSGLDNITTKIVHEKY
jgi:hypothetical protein